MTRQCNEFERVLRAGDAEIDEVFRDHAETCPSCRKQLRLWEEMPVAARHMHKSWDSPGLWPRIHQALTVESRKEQHAAYLERLFQGLAVYWRPVAAIAAVAVISLSVAWVLLTGTQTPIALKKAPERFLTERALAEVEHNEAVYIESIEKLSRLLQPRLEQADSPLMLSYREKLLLIDEAIRECRENIERNRFNAHLRQELLAMYQEKQRTLQELVKEN
jgi:hypothetical protein